MLVDVFWWRICRRYVLTVSPRTFVRRTDVRTSAENVCCYAAKKELLLLLSLDRLISEDLMESH
jgi:hypothetical protein